MGWLKRLWRYNRLKALMDEWEAEDITSGIEIDEIKLDKPLGPYSLGLAMHEGNQTRKESTMTISPNMQAKIDAVIAYMGTQPLAIDGPDEGDFDNGPIRMWVRDFADGAGRQAWRWALVEFVDTGRVFANVDFRNPWRVQAVLALNPTS